MMRAIARYIGQFLEYVGERLSEWGWELKVQRFYEMGLAYHYCETCEECRRG